jgi:hypothetical protein
MNLGPKTVVPGGMSLYKTAIAVPGPGGIAPAPGEARADGLLPSSEALFVITNESPTRLHPGAKGHGGNNAQRRIDISAPVH